MADDDFNTRAREAMIQRVYDHDMMDGLERGTDSDNPEYVRGIAEFIAASTLLSTEDGVGDAAESITATLYKSIPEVTYGVELGVGSGSEHVCALEAHSFKTAAEAQSFAEGVRGVTASAFLGLPNVNKYDPTETVDLSLPIIGASLFSYTDMYGTVDLGALY